MAVRDKMGSSFWQTLDLLVDRDCRKSNRDTIDEVDEWVDSVVRTSSKTTSSPLKQQTQQKKFKSSLKSSFSSDMTSLNTPDSVKTIRYSNQIQIINEGAANGGTGGGENGGSASSGYSSWVECGENCVGEDENVSDLDYFEIDESVADSLGSTINGPKFVDLKYKIREPNVRARLEHLMETNLVKISSRKYMQELEQRIREDYVNSTDKRIEKRMAHEMERQKRLILTGKIPFDQAPDELWMHPALLIDRYANRVIEHKRKTLPCREAKFKVPTTTEFVDPTPDPSTDLTIGNGHRYNPEKDTFLSPSYVEKSAAEEIKDGYMFTDADYQKLFYTNPLVTQMAHLESIDDLYSKAEEILGPLKTLSPP